MIPTRTQLPAWTKPFIGIPYKLYGRDFDGVDCWGLVYLVARGHFGMELPFYGPASADAREMGEIDCLVRDEISSLWTRFDRGCAGDIALFRNQVGQLVHVGIIVDECWMLHCRDVSDEARRLGRCGLSAPLRFSRDVQQVIEGFYRFTPEDEVA